MQKCKGSYFDYVLGKCVNITENPHFYHEYSKTRGGRLCRALPGTDIRSAFYSHASQKMLGILYMFNGSTVYRPDGKEYNEGTKNCTSRETASCQLQLENENKLSLSNFPFVDYL